MARFRRSSPPPPRPVRTIPGPRVFDYKDIATVVKFLGPQGQIQSRRRTGFTAQQQRSLKAAVKRARHVGLLPFVG